MTDWLFDSKGQPIAYVDGGNVFSRAGHFVGVLHGKEVWNERYVGEVIEDDRLVYKDGGRSGSRTKPTAPLKPFTPFAPLVKLPILMPFGYRDVDLR